MEYHIVEVDGEGIECRMRLDHSESLASKLRNLHPTECIMPSYTSLQLMGRFPFLKMWPGQQPNGLLCAIPNDPGIFNVNQFFSYIRSTQEIRGNMWYH